MTEVDERAKQPVSALLAGPYGHPFHPMMVTIPIGAWVCSLVFDIASHVAEPASTFSTGARWLIAIGVIGAVAAATVGFLDFFTIPAGTRVYRTAVTHMVLNLTITAAFAVGFVWRIDADGATSVGPLVLSVASLAALGLSGALGGKLAYHYGVRVASEDVQAEGFTPVRPGTPDAPTPAPPSRKGA
jgi:uncharacterized membrane protein